MRIGIDVDGVLTDVQDYVFETGAKYAYEHGYNMTDWKKEEYNTKDMFRWSEEIDDDFWISILDDYSKSEKPRICAPEVVRKLKELGHSIYIITARYSMTEEDKKEGTQENNLKVWLEEHDIPYDKLIFAQRKKKAIIENEIDVMIEDSPYNIADVEDYTKIIVFDNIYNKGVEHRRVNSWYEILHIIENAEELL